MEMNEQKNKILSDWFETNKFKKVVEKMVCSYGFEPHHKDFDDFIDIANEVFTESLMRWNEKDNFDTFFISNLKRKFATYLRDCNRLKNGGAGGSFKSKHDDETDPTMELRFREKLEHDRLKLILLSINDETNSDNGVSLSEKVTQETIRFDESLDNRFYLFFDKLRKREKKILHMRLQNESESYIQEKMKLDHTTYCRLCASIRHKAGECNIRVDFTNQEVEG